MDADKIRERLNLAMGPHEKAEQAIKQVLPYLLAELYEKIDSLENRVHAIEYTDRVPGGLP